MRTTTYFRATFADGRVAVRSTQSKAYAFCWLRPRGDDWPAEECWASRRDLIPNGATFAEAVECPAAEYRKINKAQLDLRNARSAGYSHAQDGGSVEGCPHAEGHHWRQAWLDGHAAQLAFARRMEIERAIRAGKAGFSSRAA